MSVRNLFLENAVVVIEPFFLAAVFSEENFL